MIIYQYIHNETGTTTGWYKEYNNKNKIDRQDTVSTNQRRPNENKCTIEL